MPLNVHVTAKVRIFNIFLSLLSCLLFIFIVQFSFALSEASPSSVALRACFLLSLLLYLFQEVQVFRLSRLLDVKHLIGVVLPTIPSDYFINLFKQPNDLFRILFFIIKHMESSTEGFDETEQFGAVPHKCVNVLSSK